MQEENSNSQSAVGKSFDKAKLLIPAAIVIGALIVSGTLLYSRGQANLSGGVGNDSSRKIDVSADDDPYIGSKKAKVTIVEFSDFQCPFCRAFWSETFGQIKRDYIDAGKSVRFVYRDFPLVSLHPMAFPSAEASQCANEQGKFWEFHDKVFEEQDKRGVGTIQYTQEDLFSWAAAVGLNESGFKSCMDSRKYQDEVNHDVADGSEYGVSGTPTFFINGSILVGAQPYSSFKAVIDAALAK